MSSSFDPWIGIFTLRGALILLDLLENCDLEMSGQLATSFPGANQLPCSVPVRAGFLKRQTSPP